MKHVLLPLLFTVLVFGACQSDISQPPITPPEPVWHQQCDQSTAVLLGQGDELQLVFHTAPELSRIVVIGSDGHLHIPYSDPIPASRQTLEVVRSAIITAMTSELRDPDIDVFLISAAPRTDHGRNSACTAPH